MKKKIMFMVLGLLMLCATAYAGTGSYTGTVQPTCIDRELGQKTKTTNNDYFSHQLTYMGSSYNAVYGWMETPGGTNLSNPETKFTEGSASKRVNFYSSQNKSTGDKVVLNIENADYVAVQVEVAGNYNYQ